MSHEIEPVNIGNPTESTILDFAQKINAYTGNQAGIQFKPLPTDDPKQRQPNIAKAKRILGWEPKGSLDQGMAETVTWFAARLKRTESV